MMAGFGWGMSWGGWVFMVMVLALLVAGVIWLIRGSTGHSEEGGRTARKILDERFASGDISAEEYETRRRALR